MTGFGRAEIDNENFSGSMEIKSINSRYKEILLKLPRNLNIIDNEIRSLVNQNISRGKIEANLSLVNNSTDSNQILINEGLAHSLSKALDKLLKYNTLIEPSVDLSIFTNYPEVLILQEENYDSEEIWKQIEPMVEEALNSLIQSRIKEGRRLENDIRDHYEKAKEIIAKIKELAPESINESQKKLRERLETYLKEVELDEVRFLNEVAILSDKLAIDEEITRLESHMNQFEDLIKAEEPIGRKMDFLIQELNRETNTIGSKTDSIEITNLVVDLKSEIEKMREQAQNVE